MKALVVYESIYGNTRRVGEAIATGFEPVGEVEVQSVQTVADEAVRSADLIIVGGPTHMHGLSTSMSRRMGAQAELEEDVKVEPGATDEPGLRQWLAHRSEKGKRGAAFDTRLDRSPTLTGAAARGISRRLRRRGFEIIAEPESFLVEEAEGPLADGEVERARDWGATLAKQLAVR